MPNKSKITLEIFPTLSEVLMIEKSIKKYSRKFNQKELWKKLPEKMLWQTYLIIIDYLETTNKIIIDKDGIIL